jgi:hypothetical protein
MSYFPSFWRTLIVVTHRLRRLFVHKKMCPKLGEIGLRALAAKMPFLTRANLNSGCPPRESRTRKQVV